jgi:hypothetical protein
LAAETLCGSRGFTRRARRKSGGAKRNSPRSGRGGPFPALSSGAEDWKIYRPRCTAAHALCHKPCRAADRRRHSRSTIARRLPSRTGRRHRGRPQRRRRGATRRGGGSCSNFLASSFHAVPVLLSLGWRSRLDAQARVASSSSAAQLRRPAWGGGGGRVRGTDVGGDAKPAYGIRSGPDGRRHRGGYLPSLRIPLTP